MKNNRKIKKENEKKEQEKQKNIVKGLERIVEQNNEHHQKINERKREHIDYNILNHLEHQQDNEQNQQQQQRPSTQTNSSFNNPAYKLSIFSPKISQIIHQGTPLILSGIGQKFTKSTIEQNLSKQLSNNQILALLIIELESKKRQKQDQNSLNQDECQREDTKIYEVTKMKNFTQRKKGESQVTGEEAEIQQVNKIDQNPLKFLERLQLKNYLHNKNSSPEKSDNLATLRQNTSSYKHYKSWSIHLYPTNKSINHIFTFLPPQIIPLSQCDLYSYKKHNNSIRMQYIFGYESYKEKVKESLQTQIYLNCGKGNVKFRIESKKQREIINDEENKFQEYFKQYIVKEMEIIVIPPGTSYEFMSIVDSDKNISFCLLNWRLLPKCYIFQMINLVQSTSILLTPLTYSLTRILIDYAFHQFTLKEAMEYEAQFNAQNKEILIYNFINFVNQNFQKQYESLIGQKNKDKVLNNYQQDDRDSKKILESELFIKSINDRLINGKKIPRNVEKCEKCQKIYIVNYWAQIKNKVHCAYCIRQIFTNSRVVPSFKLYQRISKTILESGIKFLIQMQSYKLQLQSSHKSPYIHPQKILKHACFFEYQDLCDGEFIGSYNSIHCKFIQNQNFQDMIVTGKDKLVDNSIKNTIEKLGLKEAKEVFKLYSQKAFKNQKEKQEFRSILMRADYFMKKEEGSKVLQELFPSFKNSNLRLLAIQLCANKQNLF